MSMNFFYKAFPSERIEAMRQDNRLIDTWILDEDAASASMDVETSWDVLQTVLDGQGFSGGARIDDALFNGCLIASPGEVAQQAKRLADWTGERVLEALAEIDPEGDLYHAGVWTDEDNQEELLDHFENLKSFFAQAAGNGWGIVLYPA